MLISQSVVWPLMVGRAGPRVALHVGAHRAEELDMYEKLKFERVDWVEAQPDLCEELKQRLPGSSNRVYQACVWGTTGLRVNLRITNNSHSSSILPFGSHSRDYPNVRVDHEISVSTIRLDEFLQEKAYSFVNLDIQGAELEALKGMGDLISTVDVVYTEVNNKEVYEGCALIDDLDEWLGARDFRRIVTKWTSKGWGDAIYLRNPTSWRGWAVRTFFRVDEIYRSLVRRWK